MIYLDDCLNILKKVDRKSVDLIYLDPPFFTQKVQKLGKDNRFFEFNDVWKSRERRLSIIHERTFDPNEECFKRDRKYFSSL